MDKFIGVSYDIEILYSNMGVEANLTIYYMEFKKLDFEIWVVRHQGKSQLVSQMRNAHTRVREEIKKFIPGSYDIVFLCLLMQIKANGAIYNMESKKHDFES